MHGVAHAMKRTGLSRAQLYYMEELGLLGAVARRGEYRRYSEAQLAKIERIAACRRMGLRLDEAGSITGAQIRGEEADVDRLHTLARAKIKQLKAEMEALLYILTVVYDLTAQARQAA